MSAGFVLDLHRCVGCGACVLACRIENGRIATAAWRRVLPLNLCRYDAGPTYFLSVACHHCDEPACLQGCPTGAYEQRPDGIVMHVEDRCVGCRYCEMTCPFGTPQFDADRGVMSKCHLCAPRVDAGRVPACVTACPTAALAFSTDVDAVDAGADRLRQGYGVSAGASAAAEAPAYVRSDATTAVRPFVPGFADPAGCRPNLRFRTPAGSTRAARFDDLEERLRP